MVPNDLGKSRDNWQYCNLDRKAQTKGIGLKELSAAGVLCYLSRSAR